MMKYLDHLEEIIITFLIAAATVIIALAVGHRYLSGLPIPALQDWLLTINMSWAQELCIYMFVWMAKFGAAYGVRSGIHVGVDVIVTRLPDSWRKVTVIIAILGGALFTGLIGTLGAKFVWENGMHYAVFNKLGMNITDLIEGPITPDLEWPTWIIYSAVPLGSYLMCFRFLQVGVAFLRTGELPHHDHAHVDGIDEIGTLDATEALEEYEQHKFNHKQEQGGVK
ncbi:TRAP transporter small permease [Geomonas paludis]|uniref:C4-dicarboxylate ABC transporter substrate-binding protein n=1 Tax=Geomonas paludis TaxID=2740185 RepID=A0A6V8MWI3_9BACT|nr:TRAP transporter small permease [Geomonas paludis]GFO64431.1 C4-dicarboxylate ABC transporter substrate-binding protein [Geomonas paludis]